MRDNCGLNSSYIVTLIHEICQVASSCGQAMKTLVIVPCGKRKIWDKNPKAGPTKAKNAYTGSPFKVNWEYAEIFGDPWAILSAKYGFLEPDQISPENNNVTFNDPSTNPITIPELKKQVERSYSYYTCIVTLGGRTYSEIASHVFFDEKTSVSSPAAGLPIGKAMAKIKNASRAGKPFTCEEAEGDWHSWTHHRSSTPNQSVLASRGSPKRMPHSTISRYIRMVLQGNSAKRFHWEMRRA